MVRVSQMRMPFRRSGSSGAQPDYAILHVNPQEGPVRESRRTNDVT